MRFKRHGRLDDSPIEKVEPGTWYHYRLTRIGEEYMARLERAKDEVAKDLVLKWAAGQLLILHKAGVKYLEKRAAVKAKREEAESMDMMNSQKSRVPSLSLSDSDE
jgi:hypothetical protein